LLKKNNTPHSWVSSSRMVVMLIAFVR